MCSWNLFSGLNFCLNSWAPLPPSFPPQCPESTWKGTVDLNFHCTYCLSFRVFPSIYSNGNFVSIGQGFPNLILTLSRSLLIPPSTIHLDHIQLLYTIHHSSLTLSQFPASAQIWTSFIYSFTLFITHIYISFIHSKRALTICQALLFTVFYQDHPSPPIGILFISWSSLLRPNFSFSFSLLALVFWRSFFVCF